MNFSELPPSEQWAALTFKGAKLAEVWFKPEGEPWGLTFRVPPNSFQIPGIGQRLTTEKLLKAVGIPTDDVESWHYSGASDTAVDGSDPALMSPLPHPGHDDTHLKIYVHLKPPAKAAADIERTEPAVASAEWQNLEVLWKAILGLEATVDTSRMSMESLRAELESSLRRTLTADEKTHSLVADVAQWNKAKSRAHFALPKANEFIHRATWAAGTPERKKLGELFKNPIETQTSLPPADEVLQELEFLRKDWQVLSAQGVTVYQECKSIAVDVQSALRRLQTNSAVRASKKKGGTGAKGKAY